ncbi:MAG: hypothetical protein ACKOXB_14010 [Flavobacteriales bacterium]
MYKKGLYTIFSLLVLLGFGCKREGMVGDKVIFVTENPLATGLTVNNANPDFSTSNKKQGTPVSFAATFSTDVSWKIVIEGNLSKATKEIKGTGKTIDNTNSVWEGDATSIQFFMKNDTCTASLYVTGIDTAISSVENIIIKKMLSYHLRTVDGVRYLLVDDYDGNHMGTKGMEGLSGDGFDNGTPYYVTTTETRINGSNAFHMEGTDINNNGWLFSMNHKDLVEMVTTNDSTKNILSHDPDNFYVNIYIRGTGKPNSAVHLKMYEYDFAPTSKALMDSLKAAGFVYTVPLQAKNDGWIYIVNVNWEGWKLVSVPYSQFRVDNDLAKGGAGNHIKEPWKITAMAVSLLSDPAYGHEVEADVDFVILSEGGPFVPKY